MDLHTLTIPEASKGLAEKKFSSVELTNAILERIEATDKDIHSFVTVTKDEAISAANEADARIQKGEHSPLTGIPASIKDVLATKGVKTTACSNILRNYTAPYDATSVSKLKKQGSVTVGKVNCDAFAHGASTENSDFGASKNPHDLSRVPGGSSGGSSSCIAAQQAIYSIGTDTGGSIRQPAAFCGVSSIKPTYGRVSRYGLFSMTSSTDCVSPMAKTVEGLAYILESIAGKDSFDSTTLEKPVPRYSDELRKADISSFTVGVPKEYFTDGMNEGVRKAVEEAIEVYSKMGAKVVPVSLPHTEFAVPVYYIITPSEVSSNLARYDGIRYGYSAITDKELSEEVQNLFDVYAKSRKAGFGDETKRRIMIGTYALSSGYYDAYYKQASKVRTLIRQDFHDVFKSVDALAVPTTPKVAFKLGSQDDDPLQMYLEDIFVAPASLAGMPAMSIPCGFAHPNDDDTIELPVGLQLIAPQFEETRLFQLGHIFQQETDWHTKLPQV
jgi:aspartyl-tRNA(Asn)/glutamyl-tRNA(Gln) amidotransferase subunit A